MIRLATALAIALSSAVPCFTSGFSDSSMISLLAANRSDKSQYLTTAFYHPTTFERAVECASDFELCDIDELVELSAGKCCLAYISHR